jgi:hypothetical protein
MLQQLHNATRRAFQKALAELVVDSLPFLCPHMTESTHMTHSICKKQCMLQCLRLYSKVQHV